MRCGTPTNDVRLFRMWPKADCEGSELEGERKWALPNIRCPSCSLTTGPKRVYPCVDLSRLTDTTPFINPRPVSVERFQELCETVRPIVPAHLPLEKCIGLGPFSAVATVPLQDYAVAFLWGSPLFKTDAFERVLNSGNLKLQHCRAKITLGVTNPFEMMELQIDGFVSLANRNLPSEGLRVCPLCGNNNIKELPSERVVVKRSSVPEDGDYFDLVEFPTAPIVTGRLKDAIESAGVSNVRFDEIEILDE